jgi:hypothetical protein
VLDRVAETLYELESDVRQQTATVEDTTSALLWTIFGVFFAVGHDVMAFPSLL